MPSLFVLGPILMVGIMTAVSSALPGDNTGHPEESLIERCCQPFGSSRYRYRLYAGRRP
jgi:hypothetical protein